MFSRPLLLSLLTARILLSQTSAAPNAAVELKRTPAPAAQQRGGNLVDRFDFGANVQALQRALENSGAVESPSAAPPGYHPATEVTLTDTAKQAVQFSASWRAQQNQAAPGPDGRVLFAFGAGLPTVVCAPLRVCLIEMQSGEKLVGEPQIGDSVRWNVAPATYGKGDETTSVLVLKPQMPGLDTNLFITTDRRAYYVRLVSKADDYVSRVAFRYNDDDGGKKWKEHFADQKREELAWARTQNREQSGLLVAVEHLHFDYQIKGGDDNIRPQRVFDDGAKTYIQISAATTKREAPVLVVIGADGKGEVTNYRVKDQMYIVDRLFERAQLVLGSGKKAQKVEISRDHRG